jgi:thiol-disulfide isomerase/thioredoxin
VPGIIGLTRRPNRREWRRAIITFVVGIAAVFLIILLVHPSPPMLQAGTPAPAIALGTIGGQSAKVLPSADHHPVVVEFIEAGCVTCQQEAAALCRLGVTYPQVTFVAIDAAAEPAATVQGFAARYLSPGCTTMVLLDPGLKVSRSYDARVVPTVYVVDSAGKIAYGGLGASGIEGVAPVLQRLTNGG